MKPFPRPLLASAREQFGLVTVAELDAARITGRQRAELLATGQLVPMHRGVYRLGSHPVTFELRCAAALLAAPDATLSGRTCGRLWGLRKLNGDDVHLLAHRRIQLDGVTAHRTDFLCEDDITVRSGLRMLRPLRMLCDLAWFVDQPDLESVFEQMLDRRMLTVPSARSYARRFVASGRPGSVRLMWLLDSRESWLRPPDSDLELRLWRALDARGLRFERQVPLQLDSGRTIVFDLALPALRFGVEVDHVTWHGGRLDAERDKRRDREAMRRGWVISRVTDDDIEARLADVCADIVAIVERRATGRG